MRLKNAFVGFGLLLIAGCGELGLTNHNFETGTYKVTGATLASGSDTCGLLPSYTSTDPQKVIGIAVAGDVATFNLPNDPGQAANTLPTATLADNALVKRDEANYTVNWETGCVTRVQKFVEGDVTGDNAAALTLTFNVTTEAGTCNNTTSGFPTVPCSSNLHFIATKQ
jgi:hypothetical protein